MHPTREELIADVSLAEREERRMDAYRKSLRVADVRWDCDTCDFIGVVENLDDECPVCSECGERLTCIPVDAKGEPV